MYKQQSSKQNRQVLLSCAALVISQFCSPSSYAETGTPPVKPEATPDLKQAKELSKAEVKTSLCAEALKAIEQKDYAQAQNLLKGETEKNDPLGLYCLGIMKLKGLGTDKNIEEGLASLKEAAACDNIKAQMQLAEIYCLGEDVPVDNQKALHYLEAAAELGDTQAQLRLGKFLQEAEGVKNTAKAVEWLQKAATTNSDAKCMLAKCYSKGNGVGKDEVQAFSWWKKAAEDGNGEAQNSLGQCYLSGAGTSVNDKEAVKWLLKAATANNADAQNSLGSLYLEGRGVPADKAQAISWLQKSVKQGNKEAQKTLADAQAPAPTVCYQKFLKALYYAKGIGDINNYLSSTMQAQIAKMPPAGQQAAFTLLKTMYIGNPKFGGEKLYGRMARIKIEGGQMITQGHEYQVHSTEVEMVLENGFWHLNKSATNAVRWY